MDSVQENGSFDPSFAFLFEILFEIGRLDEASGFEVVSPLSVPLNLKVIYYELFGEATWSMKPCEKGMLDLEVSRGKTCDCN